MKKLVLFISVLVILSMESCVLFANSEKVDVNFEDFKFEEVSREKSGEAEVAAALDTESNDSNEKVELSGASKEIIESMDKKDKRIAELSDKYNNETMGYIAYFLEIVRYYSTPVFFIFLTIGAFNFFIIGNKKLDKREQGFGWITTCLIGWVFFQCIPLVFAIFAI